MNTSAGIHPTEKSRSPLPGMGITYAMGTFNDNFFKQATMLLAAGLGMQFLQGVATVLFALPFVLFSAWGGWIADRFPKRNVIIGSKYLELSAMVLGALVLWSVKILPEPVYWGGILLVIFIMSTQSSFFSPALNGAIPESFSADRVPGVNAILKLATTVTILMGIALGGFVLDLSAFGFLESFVPEALFQDEHFSGRILVGSVSILVSLIGIITAYLIMKSPQRPRTQAPFPLWGPVDSLRHLGELRKRDSALFLAILGEAFFYGASLYTVNCLNNLGKRLEFSNTGVGLLSVALMVGVCLGAFVAGKWDAKIWRRSLVPSGMGMAAGIFLASLAPFFSGAVQFPYLLMILVFTGLCGGIYLIPIVSFVQIRPEAYEKGKILGVSNFSSFFAILLSGLLFSMMSFAPPEVLLLLGSLIALWFMIRARRNLQRLPDNTLSDVSDSLFGFFLRFLLGLRYKITVKGRENIPAPSKDAPILFLPNHPALIDPFVVYSGIAGAAPRPLGDSRQLANPLGRLARKAFRVVVIPDPEKDGSNARAGIIRGMKAITQALAKDGDNVLFYPSGRIYRSSKESMGANSGTAGLIKNIPGLRVVLIRCTGLWGSRFSYAFTGERPSFFREVGRGFLILLANAFFFVPRRKLTLEFVESADLPREGDKAILNPWLDDFYNQSEKPAFTVPYFFWQGSEERAIPEKVKEKESPTAALALPPEIADFVYRAIRETAGLPAGEKLSRKSILGTDLGMDSFMLMELFRRLGEICKVPLQISEEIVTVGDCLDMTARAVRSA